MMEYVDLKEYNEEHPEAPKDISTKTLINDEDLKDKILPFNIQCKYKKRRSVICHDRNDNK